MIRYASVGLWVLATGCVVSGDAYEARKAELEADVPTPCTDANRFDAWADADGDGFGAGAPTRVCTLEDGQVGNADDCNDADAAIHPDADEIPADGVDQDCDGAELCPADADADGFTGSDVVSGPLACQPSAAVDCDDEDAAVNPLANEACNGVDDDCDGVLGADESDDDQDGFRVCEGDCDDGDADVRPGAVEAIGDLVDQDCDGLELCYVDNDNDGFGSGAITSINEIDCTTGAASIPGDCDDTDNSVYPGAIELCDGNDNDCDGTVGGWVSSDLEAFATLQEAAETVSGGTPIYACPGTHLLRYDLDISLNIVGRPEPGNPVRIHPGVVGERIFASNEGLQLTSVTIDGLDMDVGGPGGCIAATMRSVTLTDTTVQNCVGTDGGAVHLGSSASGVFTDTTFLSNRSTLGPGGALMCDTCLSLVVTGGLFEDNVAALLGGGIHANTTQLTIDGTAFTRNDASTHGGGVSVINTAPTVPAVELRNLVFATNSAGQRGGGLRTSAAVEGAAITNCTFVENSALEGGGAYLQGELTDLVNATFATNIAESGGALFVRTPSTVTVSEANFVDNIATTTATVELFDGDLALDGSVFTTNAAPDGHVRVANGSTLTCDSCDLGTGATESTITYWSSGMWVSDPWSGLVTDFLCESQTGCVQGL